MDARFESAVNGYMKDHAMFFGNPREVARNLKARLIDDELRASWMDGLLQCNLHLRFLVADIMAAKSDAFDPSFLDRLDLSALCDLVLDPEEIGTLSALAIPLGVFNVRVVRTMLVNIQKLWNDLSILVPFHRLKGFVPIPMSDAKFYEKALKPSKANPDVTESDADCAVAAIYTIMNTIPLGNLWIEKHEELLKKVS